MTNTLFSKNYFLKGLLIVIGLTSITSCAGQRAQLVAFETLKAVSKYEEEVQKKIQAEKTFYKKNSEILQAKLGGVNQKILNASKNTAITSPAPPQDNFVLTNEEIKKTWLYGYIRTSGAKEARRAAGEILSSPDGLAISKIMDFAAQGINKNHNAISEVRLKQKELANRIAKNLQPLQKQKKRLATLRKGLTKLTTKPTDSKQLSQIISMVKIAVEEMEKGNSGQ